MLIKDPTPDRYGIGISVLVRTVARVHQNIRYYQL
jgi:hypothetical protein